MLDATPIPFRRSLRRLWPWLVVVLTAVPAVWHVIDFEEDADPEFPRVVRPTFSRRPPPAYRLAEPGDTIDRVTLYLSAGAVVISLAGLGLGRGPVGLWPAALAISLGAFWYAATPGPTFDGWHGLGWRAITDPEAPLPLRIVLVGAALGLSGIVTATVVATRSRWGELADHGRAEGIASLLVAALVLVALRQEEIPGVEPAGYWPRWFLVAGLIAFDLALVRAMPDLGSKHWLCRFRLGLMGAAGWVGLVAAGLWLTWYHRPLERLRAVVPGTIYISAMPTARTGGHVSPPPLQDDHQPVPRGHAVPKPPATRRVAVRPRAWDSLPRQHVRRDDRKRVPRPDSGAGPGPGRLADPGPLPRVPGPHARMDGDLSLRRRGPAPGRDHAGDRASSRLSAQGVGDTAL